MTKLDVLMPLAQMNTNAGGLGGTPVAGQPAAAPGVAAPAAAPAQNGAAAVTSEPGSPPNPNPDNQGGRGGGMGSFGMFLPLILMFVVLYFIMTRPQRKEEKRRKELLGAIKKGDKVMTIGGMVGRVVSIDGDEVVLKVDESANVKATYRKTAIQEVLDDDKK